MTGDELKETFVFTAKSLLAGAGSAFVFGLGVAGALLVAEAGTFTALFVETTRQHPDLGHALLVGLGGAAAVFGVGTYAAYKLFTLAPSRWIAALGLVGMMLSPSCSQASLKEGAPEKPAPRRIIGAEHTAMPARPFSPRLQLPTAPRLAA